MTKDAVVIILQSDIIRIYVHSDKSGNYAYFPEKSGDLTNLFQINNIARAVMYNAHLHLGRIDGEPYDEIIA